MASTSGSSEMSLRTNLNFWKEQMQDYLIVHSQIDPIEHENAPATHKLEEWKRLDRIAHATIQIYVSESVYYTVQLCTTTKELWKTLSDTYEKKVATTKLYLR
jgi:hypothetical protein